MSYKPGDTLQRVFTTNGSTGAAVNADTTPTVQLVRNGAVDSTVTVTVTNLSTGVYLASCSLPTTYAAGDRVQLLLTATVSGVTGVATTEAYVLDKFRVADVTDGSGRVTLTSSEHTLIGTQDVPSALDMANSLETNVTIRQALRLMASVLLGQCSGATGSSATITFTAAANNTTNRVVATVDANGNRTSIHLTP